MTWKDIKGYEGRYQINEAGQIKRLARISTLKNSNKKRKIPEKIMTNVLDKDGYLRVNLEMDGKLKRKAIHRLLAIQFLQPVEGKNIVNHKDGNKLNNNIDNLEWCTFSENNNHAFDNGLIKTGHKVKVFDKSTGEEKYFRSLSHANRYIGKSTGYLSKYLKTDILIRGDYIIERTKL